MDKLAMALFGGVAVLVQTLQHYHQNDFYVTWALVTSALGVALSGLAFLVLLFQKEQEASACLRPIIILLVIVWIGGTSVMTLKGPYHDTTGNGYFGAWLALGMSWLLAFDALPITIGRLDTLCRRGGEAVGALTLASLTVLVQTLWNHVGGGSLSGEILWILVCSGVSLLICVLLHASGLSTGVQAKFCYVALFLMIWWTAGFFVATFDSPYTHTGNGFFGCWVALLASMALFDSAWGVNASAVRKVPSELLGLFLGDDLAFFFGDA